jgi:hypothetical protein
MNAHLNQIAILRGFFIIGVGHKARRPSVYQRKKGEFRPEGGIIGGPAAPLFLAPSREARTLPKGCLIRCKMPDERSKNQTGEISLKALIL